MKKTLFLLLGLLAGVSVAHAQSWTKTVTQYAIYMDGGQATMSFGAPSSLPVRNLPVTSVDYVWTPYPNGNTRETVELCFSAPYVTTPGKCVDISNSRTGRDSTNFRYQEARGTFYIRHTLRGGKYPIYSTGRDTVTVNYTN